MMPKQAVILCAGLGTRLSPLTDTIPKPMIPLLGRPLLEWNIEQFEKHGIKEFFINLHHLPEVIRSYFGDGTNWGVKINYSFEPQILGTAGGMKQFENLLNQEFFVIYGDMISLVDYSKMARWFENLKDPVGAERVQKTDDYVDADVAELDEKRKFIAIHPKPHREKYANAYRLRGIFIFKREILGLIPPVAPFEIGSDLLPAVLRRGLGFYGYECDEYSKGIDTMDKYREVEDYLSKIKK